MAKNGNTTENISISIPSKLLQIVDHCAGRIDLNRSKFIEKAIKAFILQNAISFSGMGSEIFWNQVYKKIFN